MKDYIVVDTLTGPAVTIKSGHCPDECFFNQVGQDEFIIEGEIDQSTQKVVDGKVVDKTKKEINSERFPIPDELDIPKFPTVREWNALLKRVEDLEKG